MPASSSLPGSIPQSVVKRRRPPAPPPPSSLNAILGTSGQPAAATHSPTPGVSIAASPHDPITQATVIASQQGSIYGTPTLAQYVNDPRQYLTSPAQRLQSLLSRPYPGLSSSQQNVLNTVLETGLQQGATRKQLLSAVETGLVESGLQNLPYGDADSEGWRQERTSIYGPTAPTNVKGAAKRYFQEAYSDTGGSGGAGMTAGQLAQAIQGSAYPDRYDEVKGQAAPLLAEFLQRVDKSGVPTPNVKPPPQANDPSLSKLLNYVQPTESWSEIASELGTKRGQAELNRLTPETKQALIEASKQAGEPIDITEGWRSRSRQEYLYGPGRGETTGVVAAPGTSPHEHGVAVDIANNDPAVSDALISAGFETVPGDPGHYQLANPTMTAPSSGGGAVSGGVGGPVSALTAATAQGATAGAGTLRDVFKQRRADAASQSTLIDNPLAAQAALPEGVAVSNENDAQATSLAALLGDQGTAAQQGDLAGILERFRPRRRLG